MKLKYYKNICITTALSIGVFGLAQAQNTKIDTVAIKKSSEKYTNIGFGVQRPSIITGAISSVEGKDLEKNFNTNLANTLFGKLSGITLMQGNTEPGNNAPTILARGLGTFGGAGTSPLIIIDGFDTDQNQAAFNSLSPEEIESISYLKDAASTAVYGFRGGNGVLLVTTKRGKEGPLKVSFSTRQGFTQAIYLPKYLGSYDYATLYNEALANGGQTARYTQADLDSYQSGNDPFYHPDVNWYNQVLRKSAPVSSYNINFNGGTPTVKYFLMLNALTDGGLYQNFGDQDPQSTNSGYSKYNFRSNLDFNFNKNLSAVFSLGGSVTTKSNPGSYNTDTTFGLLSLITPNAFPVYNPDGSLGGNSTYTNPVGNVLKTGAYHTDGRAIQASLRINDKLDFITPGLSATVGATLNSYFSSGSAQTKSYARYTLSKDASGNPVYAAIGSNTSAVAQEDILDQYHTYEFQGGLNYDRSFGLNHIMAMAIFDSGNYTISGNNPAFKHVGGAGRLTYVYNERYIAEASAGYTGSENFPPGKRFGFFPTASLGWVASNEGFLKNNHVISFLKIRGSYGLSGNDRISGSRFAFTQVYPSGASYIFGTGTTLSGSRIEGTLANPDLTWEKIKQGNIGMDLTLLNKLQFSVDFFKQDRYDIIVPASGTVAQYIGATTAGVNQGKTTNKGVEASLGYNSDPSKSLKYFVATNFSFARNKVIVNREPVQLYNYAYTAGRKINQPFGYQVVGFLTADEANPLSPSKVATPVGIPVQAGDLKYKDQNGDGIIDQNDNVAMGSPNNPEITVGLHAGISYKWFDLDLVFQGVQGSSVYLSGAFYQAFQSNGTVSEIALGRWTPATAATATYPRLSTTGNQNNYLTSSFYQQSGDFIKMRSAEMGYTFDKSLTTKIKISSARLFVTGTNLFSLDHVKYGDPETINGYPDQRTFTLGARVQF